MPHLLRLVVVAEPDDVPHSVRELIDAGRVEGYCVANCHQACEPSTLAHADAILVALPTDPYHREVNYRQMQLLADALASHRLTGVVFSPGTFGVVPGEDDTFMYIPPEASADELYGRIAAIRQFRPLLTRMDEQVAGMQRLGRKLNEQFVEVDQELRLASRLQRDFLPKNLPEIGEVRFGTVYRPAAWVSGDVYDVQRLDECHLSFYLADAVGHGVAAGLLTMFIKQAVAGKQVFQNDYAILSPSEVLERLNVQLTEQQLPNCQFVTACYGTVDLGTYEVSLARAGHPHPIHVGIDGTCAEVRTLGGLLGIFQDETFPSTQLVLQPGEKLIVYSDGLEDLVVGRRDREKHDVAFSPEFQAIVRKPLPAFIEAVEKHLDDAEGSLEPEDDITLIALERLLH